MKMHKFLTNILYSLVFYYSIIKYEKIIFLKHFFSFLVTFWEPNIIIEYSFPRSGLEISQDRVFLSWELTRDIARSY